MLCAEALNKTKAGSKSKNLHTHGQTGTIAGVELNKHPPRLPGKLTIAPYFDVDLL
jgi:hypothetical protein